MRILILTQYYPPETGAPQNRLSDLAKRLAGSGHDLTVLTALPNYPQGQIFEEYRGRFMVEECCKDIRVIRTWIYATKKLSFIPRLLNYFSFVFSSLVVGVWKIGPQDIVIVESPPLFLGISGFLLSFCKRSGLVFNVSDLWPDSAVAMGILQNQSVIRLSRKLEEFLYRHSMLITGQTQGIVNNIQSRFCDKPVALITNGVDVKTFLLESKVDRGNGIRTEFGFGNKFVIGYAGLHGLAQGLDTLVYAAHLLAGQEDLFFAMFGDGPEKEKLVQTAEKLKLTNISFYPSQAAGRMPAILRSFDVAVVPLKRLDLFKGALPSKMFEAMAAAVPIIVTIDGEAREVVEKAHAGIAIEAENPQAMADAILQLYRDQESLKTLGLNGQQYVIQHYDREQIARDFERLLVQNYCPQPAATSF
jgi:glycosyltransferase involved in cell wall biosynthesis